MIGGCPRNGSNKARQGNGHEEHLGTTIRVKVDGEDKKKSMVGVEVTVHGSPGQAGRSDGAGWHVREAVRAS